MPISSTAQYVWERVAGTVVGGGANATITHNLRVGGTRVAPHAVLFVPPTAAEETAAGANAHPNAARAVSTSTTNIVLAPSAGLAGAAISSVAAVVVYFMNAQGNSPT